MNTSLKRSYSVSESDDCSEEDLNGGGNCAVTSGTQCYRSPTRKRRRGVIEKRRRDRINVSLDELKRLVPQALEKSGSAKLEKAEILQMTVDHLKVLHANKVYDMNGSYKSVQPDTHKIAADYHGLGFRECASEVARYLISVEGLDDTRLRLMSHLQMFLSQKEFSTKAAMNHGYNTQVSQPLANQYQPPNQAWAAYPGYYGEAAIPKSSNPYVMPSDALSYFAPLAPPSALPPHSAPSSTTIISTTSITSPPIQSSTSLTTLTSTTADQWSMMNNGFGLHNNNLDGNNQHFSAFTASNAGQSHNAYGKPYRPWGGAEMAC